MAHAASARTPLAGHGAPSWRSAVLTAAGYSLAELLVVVSTIAVAGAVAVPGLAAAADAADGAAAARYLGALISSARADAARRQSTVALRFAAGVDPGFVVAVDGDGDGVSTADVAAGIDWLARPVDRLSTHFRRARIGIAAAVPGIEGGAALAATDDPVQLGVARQLSLTAFGTATSGTIYVCTTRGVQFAVRMGGVTGRARVLRYVPGTASWLPA